MRRFTTQLVKQEKVTDIKCDICGCSTRGELDRTHFEVARIQGEFQEGNQAGDRFFIEICKTCFYDLLEWILLDRKGALDYYNVVEQGQSASLDDLRVFFAHRRAGTLDDESFVHEE